MSLSSFRELDMNENKYLARTVSENLEAGLPLVLISVMSLQGSTPRHKGTKMVVGADGKSYGTIGGSLIEATAIREARGVLATAKSRILTYELAGSDAAAPGMICGGQAELLLDYLPPSPENREFAGYWQAAVLRGQDFFLLTHLEGDGEKLRVPGHAILYPDGAVAGHLAITASEIEGLKPGLPDISLTAVLPLEHGRLMVDRVRSLKTLYCFGAGHVAVPTAQLAALVGFRVVVLDDRPEFANAERFPDADEIRLIDDFSRAFAGLEIDNDSYVVIVTRGHQHDRAVLEQALKTPAGYIGMISSRRKREAIYNALMSQGVRKELLEKVHSPIGLDIGGETPEEIGVSIVAELISVRSRTAA
jgi:xanthine dehydrogenase accessory factor